MVATGNIAFDLKGQTKRESMGEFLGFDIFSSLQGSSIVSDQTIGLPTVDETREQRDALQSKSAKVLHFAFLLRSKRAHEDWTEFGLIFVKFSLYLIEESESAFEEYGDSYL